jgi:ABC-2 type transport system permease protein
VTVAGVEWSKLSAQLKVRLVLAACAISPFAFAAAMRVQSNLPTDTLFGRSVTDSGFAIPLVVLGFAALWVFPVLAGIVGGDVFSAEDRYGTWSTVLTRSRSRVEIFAGKVIAALAFSAITVAVLAISSVAAGALVVGRQPLINLSGVLLPPGQATARVVLAWASVLLPVFGFRRWPSSSRSSRAAARPASDCLSSQPWRCSSWHSWILPRSPASCS